MTLCNATAQSVGQTHVCFFFCLSFGQQRQRQVPTFMSSSSSFGFKMAHKHFLVLVSLLASLFSFLFKFSFFWIYEL